MRTLVLAILISAISGAIYGANYVKDADGNIVKTEVLLTKDVDQLGSLLSQQVLTYGQQIVDRQIEMAELQKQIDILTQQITDTQAEIAKLNAAK